MNKGTVSSCIAYAVFVLMFGLLKVDANCNDPLFKFRMEKPNGKKIWKNCDWVSNKAEELCKVSGIKKTCHNACNKCDKCTDSPYKFKIGDKNKKKNCKWVNDKPEIRCDLEGVKETCRKACGTYGCSSCEFSKVTAQTLLAETVIADRQNDSHFGYASALFGNTLAVGAFGYDNSKGAVYVYEKNGNSWQAQNKIEATDGANSDSFGYRVAMTANTMAVTAYGINNYKGAVYVFERNGEGEWQQSQKLVDDNGPFSNRFGYSVQFSPDNSVLAIGSTGNGLYLFERGISLQWELVQNVKRSDSTFFAQYVAISDEFIVTTAKTGNYCIVVFYSRIDDVWTEFQSLSCGPFRLKGHGPQLSLSGDTLAVSTSNGLNSKGLETGIAYIFSRVKPSEIFWEATQTLEAEDGQVGDKFGLSVTFVGDVLVVGSPQEFAGGPGAAYLFSKDDDQWVENEKVMADDGVVDDNFGRSVSASDSTIAIGANFDDSKKGSVYVLECDDF